VGVSGLDEIEQTSVSLRQKLPLIQKSNFSLQIFLGGTFEGFKYL
jgi:hypothetical protein